MLALLGRLDRAVYRAERFVVVAGLFVMSVVVFIDVVHRTFADPESRVARWLAGAAGLFGEAGLAEALYPTMRDWVAPPFLFAFFLILAYIGVRWRAEESRTSRLRAWGLALALVVGAWVVVRGMIWLLPNGVVWAQALAMILTLWVGFVGASMCTFDGRHLRVEAADRLWSPGARRVVTTLANLFTAAAVLALFALSLSFIGGHWESWIQTDGYGGLVDGLPGVPQWAAFGVLPLTFLIMGTRFLTAAVAAATGRQYGRVGGDAIQAMLKEASEGTKVLSGSRGSDEEGES
ncbi:MAG: TRAP transporter small permease subunit [Deltaproteobacteria bacterium]|nr:TRAP transporter small permease subunit [Deltaproteobacteria bacterium]